MELIVVGFFVFGVAVGWIAVGRKKTLTKKSVIKCFEDVDWSIQVFHYGSMTMRSTDGEEHFYKHKSIYEAIKKLNNLIEESE